MRAGILIVGQGLAGTLLGSELERADISFTIADAGHSAAASRVAAGIVNPVTGRRLVKSWQVDSLLPPARAAYLELERTLGLPLWREMRIRRLFADDREKTIFSRRQAKGELAPWIGAADSEGFWIEGGGQVDFAALLKAARARWLSSGILVERRVEWATGLSEYELVIDCAGAASACFEFLPWGYSKGEILTVSVGGLDPQVILNRRHWILPTAPQTARVGATNEPGRRDAEITPAARAALEASAGMMLGRGVEVCGQEAGVRLTLPDRHPVAGRHPAQPHLGVLNGLGSKGALLGPWLARQWLNHLTEGVPFDQEIDVARFWRSPVPPRT